MQWAWPYCQPWPARILIFCDITSQTARLSKKVTAYKMRVLIFSTNFVWNIFHSKKNWARYDQKFILVFLWSTRYSYHILIIFELSRHTCEIYLNIKFHENPDMTELIVASRNFANALKNSMFYSNIACKWILEQVISLSTIKWLFFIPETECVYCAVRTKSLYAMQMNVSL